MAAENRIDGHFYWKGVVCHCEPWRAGAKQSQTIDIKRLPRRPDESGLLAMTKNKVLLDAIRSKYDTRGDYRGRRIYRRGID